MRMSRCPVEQPLDRDARLRPRQRRSRAGVNAVAEGDVPADVLPGRTELGRALELARVAVGGTVGQEDLVPAAMCTPPSSVVLIASRYSPRIGPSVRSTSSTNRGTRSRFARSCAWVSGSSAMRRRAVAISRTVVSCPAANRLDAIRQPRRLGHAAVGEQRPGQAGQHVVEWLRGVRRPSRRSSRRRSPACCARTWRERRRLCSETAPGAEPGIWAMPRRASSIAWSSSGTPSRSAMTSRV